MPNYWITFTLLSDATISSGDGIAGLIDREVEHDRYGLPYLRGRTLKGLLSEEAENMLLNHPHQQAHWQAVHNTLFGVPGSVTQTQSKLHFGPAQLPSGVRHAVQTAVQKSRTTGLQAHDILGSLTAIRRQTAINEETALPEEGSLRAMRVIVRQTSFEAEITATETLTEDEEALLTAAVLSWRRAGTGRNRGRGKLQADLLTTQRESLLSSGLTRFMEGWTA